MQKLHGSMDGLLFRSDLGEYERAKQHIQLQNKYLTFKQQIKQIQTQNNSSNNCRNQVHPTLKNQEKLLAIFWRIMYRHLFKSLQQSQRTEFKSQWLYCNESRESLASLIHIDTSSHSGSTFAKAKAKMSSNPVCKLLYNRGRWSSFEKVSVCSQ